MARARARWCGSGERVAPALDGPGIERVADIDAAMLDVATARLADPRCGPLLADARRYA